MTKVVFHNQTKKMVWAAMWWGSLDPIYHWKKVPAGKITDFGINTKYADGWSDEIRDAKNYTLTQCRSVRHDAAIKLTQSSGAGYCSKYEVSVDRPSTKGMGKIDHLVVVMLENRSFDNLLGWLYAPDNKPPRNLPEQNPPTFAGLSEHAYWNPDSKGQKICATKGTSGKSPFTVPDPDPQELFDHMTYQLFGTKHPKPKQPADMSGFVRDYATKKNNPNPHKIMECYSPEQIPVLSALARNYAVCDRWFASVPCQTWPNRAFVHAGTSCGRVNNCDHNKDDCIPDPRYYDTKTIFNKLEDLGISWKVYNDSLVESLTRAQFAVHLQNPLLQPHFQSFNQFLRDAENGNLPTYSFVEPGMLLPPQNDQHPAHNVKLGEKFIYDAWRAVSHGRDWETTLMVITYDEHGGCYDHVAPPWTATNPDNSKPQQPFGFNRYGVRVPAVVISPFIEPGTVFRSDSPSVEYDHTSILATLRDWLGLSGKTMLPSKRIKKAPTLDKVLTRATPRRDMPDIKPPRISAAMKVPLDAPLSSLQKSILAATALKQRGSSNKRQGLGKAFDKVKTQKQAIEYLRRRH